ncbi:hypothetical protein BWD42_15075 [Sphingobacterium sp. CZ-UAM]|uniref:hypothetical protein n=1 Tax=Sphingobacterium sp. CZ-UAM TaxID=1933868 RepID=UPI000984CD89|nr:hypothetical protein [Sphingobacterium sp. CZ-UAM]OOG17515.1 hypothetical protein BWD42_15075 [Sphingobacterium sp. CZ-UAM]
MTITIDAFRFVSLRRSIESCYPLLEGPLCRSSSKFEMIVSVSKDYILYERLKLSVQTTINMKGML